MDQFYTYLSETENFPTHVNTGDCQAHSSLYASEYIILTSLKRGRERSIEGERSFPETCDIYIDRDIVIDGIIGLKICGYRRKYITMGGPQDL